MTHDANSIAAAKLADTYIQIILSTKPELIASYTSTDIGDIPADARRLTEFRQQLINELVKQPLAPVRDDA